MSDPVEAFLSVTGVTDSSVAAQWLELAGYQIDAAIDLFFSSGGDLQFNQKSPAVVPGPEALAPASPVLETDYFGRSTTRQPAARLSRQDLYDEDGYRRPDDIKRQRLVDDDVLALSHMPTYSKSSLKSKSMPVSVFSSGAVLDHQRPSTSKELNLAELFKPPHDIITNTSFDEVHTYSSYTRPFISRTRGFPPLKNKLFLTHFFIG